MISNTFKDFITNLDFRQPFCLFQRPPYLHKWYYHHPSVFKPENCKSPLSLSPLLIHWQILLITPYNTPLLLRLSLSSKPSSLTNTSTIKFQMVCLHSKLLQPIPCNTERGLKKWLSLNLLKIEFKFPSWSERRLPPSSCFIWFLAS